MAYHFISDKTLMTIIMSSPEWTYLNTKYAMHSSYIQHILVPTFFLTFPRYWYLWRILEMRSKTFEVFSPKISNWIQTNVNPPYSLVWRNDQFNYSYGSANLQQDNSPTYVKQWVEIYLFAISESLKIKRKHFWRNCQRLWTSLQEMFMQWKLLWEEHYFGAASEFTPWKIGILCSCGAVNRNII